MKNNLKVFKTVIIRISLIIFFILVLIFFSIFKKYQHACEVYSRTVIRFYQTVVGTITKVIPFSLSEFVFFGTIIFAVVILILSIIALFKKKYYKSISRFLTTSVLALALASISVATMDAGYYREPLDIPLYEQKVEKSEFRNIIQYFLDDYNYCSSLLSYRDDGEVICPYSLKEINEKLQKEYAKLDSDYFSEITVNVKPLLTSFIYREFHITGVNFGPMGEANINTLTTNGELPFTCAHEIAHTKGVMRENDAQIVAAYIMLNSEDYYFRYSGYFLTFGSLLNLARLTNNSNDYYDLAIQLDNNIFANYDYSSEYWNSFDFVDKIGDWINNLYLKLKDDKGTISYSDTPIVVNPETEEIISFSNYQKLYFEIYFNL